MGTKDKRVDAYIAKSAEFARPILTHLRDVVHAGCPDVVETIKWGMPSFEYKGPYVGIAAFKAHCTFGFWKHDLIIEGDDKAREAMGSFGRIASKSDLPSKAVLLRYLKQAAKLNDDGVKVLRAKTRPKSPIPMHPEFKAAFAKQKRALATFNAFAPSAQREYLEWIADAKGDDTRKRRIATAIEWISAGKTRHWKYQR